MPAVLLSHEMFKKFPPWLCGTLEIKTRSLLFSILHISENCKEFKITITPLIHWNCYNTLWRIKIWVWSDQWLLRYSTFNILRSSSIRCHLHLKHLKTLVWSSKFKVKIWVWSDQWLLRYSRSNILRSSSIGDCLQFNH